MSQGIPSTLFAFFMILTVAAIVLSIFAWRWAVRQPMTHPNPTPYNSPLFYSAIGASDVVGVGATNPDTESWVNVVHGLMPPGTRFVRLGRSGITLREANQVEVPKAVAAKPDVITIWNCVNDAVRLMPVRAYTADLTRTLDALTGGTQARIFMLNLPDLSMLVQYSASPQQRELVRGGVMQWNRAIAETARRYGDRVCVIDLFDISHEVDTHPEYISGDNFHPSTAGYQRLGEYVFSAISSELSLAAQADLSAGDQPHA